MFRFAALGIGLGLRLGGGFVSLSSRPSRAARSPGLLGTFGVGEVALLLVLARTVEAPEELKDCKK